MTAGKDEPSWRICEDCGKDYFLPIGYNESCPEIRGKCIDCIKQFQRDHEIGPVPEKKPEPEKEVWFS